VDENTARRRVTERLYSVKVGNQRLKVRPIEPKRPGLARDDSWRDLE
jgi:hypothetical protein